MKLLDLIERQAVPDPWSEGEKIPWNDAAFSRRMLDEHLSQAHDAASRRAETIDRHVAWIHRALLAGEVTQILDLGCGPGLYAMRLARFGHRVVGIDFSPASVAYAQAQAKREALPCRFVEADIRRADYGSGYGLAMLIFGEFNVFHPDHARAILCKIYAALDAGGLVVLEPHTFEAVRRLGAQMPFWYATPSGLFSDRPHLCLTEAFWDADRNVATERYFIVDAQSGDVVRHATSTQAYTEEAYQTLLEQCGFDQVQIYPSLVGAKDEDQTDFMAIVARKRDAVESPSL